MKRNRFFKNIRFNIIVFLTSLLFLNIAFSDEPILYVSDGALDPPNWDIYSMNIDGTGVTRLTDSPSIDNHPDLSPDGTTVVFSSDSVGGNFEIFKAPLATLGDEGTWTKLTSFGCNNSDNVSRCTPARHPHWSPDGLQIIYTANDGSCCSDEPVVSHCSVPIKILDPCITNPARETEHYERIHIMDSDGTDDISIDLIELGLELGPSTCDSPQIFHGGHPSFNPAGDKIIFTGATNRDGTEWEVFVTGWDGTKASGVVQITNGSSYPASSNPIKMTGGASFFNDGKDIICSSTQLPKGNSQLFRIDSFFDVTLPIVLSDDYRLTFHCGNDYVPHEYGTDKIVYVSDATPPGQTWGNPTSQDIWLLNSDGSSRTNLTNTSSQSEVLLLADEVSWFCGLPRNLSPCHFIPRIYSVESFFLMLYSDDMLPANFTNRDLYSVYTNALFHWKLEHVPNYLDNINQMLSAYQMNPNCLAGEGSCPEAIVNLTLPTFMPDTDEWCPDCVPCDDCVEVTTDTLPDGALNQPYSATLQADTVVQRWNAFGGSLPNGLDLDPNTGEISGIPIEIVSLQLVSIAAIDVNGNADSNDYNISITGTASTNPDPDIKANGSDGPVTSTDNLSVTIALDPGSHTGEDADWWIVVNTPTGEWEYFDLTSGGYTSGLLPTLQGFSLVGFDSTAILNTSDSGAGTYTYYFALDLGGGQLFFDLVKVVVP